MTIIPHMRVIYNITVKQREIQLDKEKFKGVL